MKTLSGPFLFASAKNASNHGIAVNAHTRIYTGERENYRNSE